jgi:hypothetical protein
MGVQLKYLPKNARKILMRRLTTIQKNSLELNQIKNQWQ